MKYLVSIICCFYFFGESSNNFKQKSSYNLSYQDSVRLTDGTNRNKPIDSVSIFYLEYRDETGAVLYQKNGLVTLTREVYLKSELNQHKFKPLSNDTTEVKASDIDGNTILIPRNKIFISQ